MSPIAISMVMFIAKNWSALEMLKGIYLKIIRYGSSMFRIFIFFGSFCSCVFVGGGGRVGGGVEEGGECFMGEGTVARWVG